MRRYSRLTLLLALLLVLASSVAASPAGQLDSLRTFLLDARTDLEVLANTVLGEGVRPPTWTFNTRTDSLTFLADLWFDNEQLADAVFGQGARHPEWIGATSQDATIVARNVRHDLELAADKLFGPRERPEEWHGAPKIYACTRTLQNLGQLLRAIYSIQLETPDQVFDYCATISAEIDDKLIEIISGNTDLETRLPDLILAVRGDLERLADERRGLDSRPPNWIRNLDKNSPTIIGDIYLDLNNLADDQQRDQRRRDGQVVTNSAAISFRNLRHDLELLADATLGEGVPPTAGRADRSAVYPGRSEPRVRCRHQLRLCAQREWKTSPDFCDLVAFDANTLAETRLLRRASGSSRRPLYRDVGHGPERARRSRLHVSRPGRHGLHGHHAVGHGLPRRVSQLQPFDHDVRDESQWRLRRVHRPALDVASAGGVQHAADHGRHQAPGLL
jgi:hypothetical protein